MSRAIARAKVRGDIARAKVRGDHFHFRIGKHPVFELVVEQLLLSAGVLETYNITSSKPGRRP